MRAIVQTGYGSPDVLALQEIERPVASDDQVLVRIRAASVNASDSHLVMGILPHLIAKVLRSRASPIRGGDLAGVVESVGRDVTRFKPGDEVFGVAPGTFAEYAATREDRLALKPRNLTFAQAAALPGAGITALQGLRDKAAVGPGQSVLIYGAGGGVGTFAVQIAKALGARVTAVSTTANVELLRSIGTDEVVDYTKEDFSRRGQHFDVLFDIGANRSFADCRRVLGSNGKLVLVGASGGALRSVGRLVRGQLMSRIGRQRIVTFLTKIRQEDLVALKLLVEAGKLSPVLDRQYELNEVPDAIRYVGSRHAKGKVVIKVA